MSGEAVRIARQPLARRDARAEKEDAGQGSPPAARKGKKKKSKFSLSSLRQTPGRVRMRFGAVKGNPELLGEITKKFRAITGASASKSIRPSLRRQFGSLLACSRSIISSTCKGIMRSRKKVNGAARADDMGVKAAPRA
ncbi:MAG: hypothetical protein ACLPSW_27740 [Roseiarcus sp.]